MTVDQEFATKKAFRLAIQDGEHVEVCNEVGEFPVDQGEVIVNAHNKAWRARVRVEYGIVIAVMN